MNLIELRAPGNELRVPTTRDQCIYQLRQPCTKMRCISEYCVNQENLTIFYTIEGSFDVHIASFDHEGS